MANALLKLAIANNLEIVQKFLERGHTQMECDCSQLHWTKIQEQRYVFPSDYIKATKEARRSPFPYDLKEVDDRFFKDYADN